jgi:hypothetical protein
MVHLSLQGRLALWEKRKHAKVGRDKCTICLGAYSSKNCLFYHAASSKWVCVVVLYCYGIRVSN